MDTPYFEAVLKVSTANQWTTLAGFVTKVNRKLHSDVKPTDSRQLANLLSSISPEELKRNGVWLVSFGGTVPPIILTNPAFARARREAADSDAEQCKCSFDSQNSRSKRFFGSNDYNAGRHHTTTSVHVANCPCWSPPTTSHLHSWRKSYE